METTNTNAVPQSTTGIWGKLNWGWRIAITYGLFVAFILFMVYRSVQMKTELVTADYYKEELNYQVHIDKLNRTTALKSPLQWKVSPGEIEFTFPAEVVADGVSAMVFFYCPSNSKKDKTFALQSGRAVAALDISSVQKGIYEMKVEWKANNTEYYNEGVITIR